MVTIGIFDGVHKGHGLLLSRIIELVSKKGSESVVITMWPHPRAVLANQQVSLLSTLEEKIRLIEKSGIDHLVILPFTREFADTPFDEFIEKYLVHDVRAQHVVIGYNHHFGKDRKGGFEQLQVSGEKYHFKVERLNPVIVNNKMVSSSSIRQALEKGEIRSANEMLGYEYNFSGKVIDGNKLGRKLGFPTANIALDEPLKLIPPNGVYAVKAIIGNLEYGGMLSIGTRPTVELKIHNLVIEVNIFDFNKEIYGENLTIKFIDRIRDEQKFKNLNELTEKMEQDKKITLELLNEKQM